MKRTKLISLLLTAALLITGLTGCGGDAKDKKASLNVFITDSCLEVISQAAYDFKQYYPNVDMTISFESGPMQAAKIEAGYSCDIFIADAEYLLDWLDKTADKEANPNKNNKIRKGTRIELFEGPADPEYFDTETTTYCGAVIIGSKNADIAQEFLNYLANSDDVKNVCKTYGFKSLSE